MLPTLLQQLILLMNYVAHKFNTVEVVGGALGRQRIGPIGGSGSRPYAPVIVVAVRA
jgi:hypothetical protein